MIDKSKCSTIKEYIALQKKDVQKILQRLTQIIKKHVPEAEESISYGMPAYKLNKKPFAYFAAYEHHIGFYALPYAHEKFSQQLKKYKQGKGSVQFPLNEAMPFDIIEQMILFKKETEMQKIKNQKASKKIINKV